MTSNASQLNFEIELSNKFQDLKQETIRTSTGNENKESDKQHPSTTTVIPQNLPPPHHAQSKSKLYATNENNNRQAPTIRDIIKMGRTILLERHRLNLSAEERSRTTFLRSDWPRPFARREVGVEMDWVDPKINGPSIKGDLELENQESLAK
ncbi:hypothetical protein TNCV_643741 [Trichonephila clavipes]|nr:hypothetical protein TNCV_643741 [Trichonephila clavipes]